MMMPITRRITSHAFHAMARDGQRRWAIDARFDECTIASSLRTPCLMLRHGMRPVIFSAARDFAAISINISPIFAFLRVFSPPSITAASMGVTTFPDAERHLREMLDDTLRMAEYHF